MRTSAIRTLASVLAALLAFSCGTVRESRQPDIEERVFLPRTPRASTVVDELELRKAIEELLPYVNLEEARAELQRMVADPQFHGRRPGELRVVLASWGSGPVALEEIGREYRAWCAAVHRTNCHEGPLTDSSIYEIAFDFAMGSQWDGFVREVLRRARWASRWQLTVRRLHQEQRLPRSLKFGSTRTCRVRGRPEPRPTRRDERVDEEAFPQVPVRRSASGINGKTRA